MNCLNAINKSNDEVLLKLYVRPSSSCSIFPAGYNQWRNSIEIQVKAEEKENKANKEIIKQVAQYFDISKNDVRIVTGQKSREKTIAIKKIEIDLIQQKIKGSLNGL